MLKWQRDYFSYEGARYLAQKIQNYWEARGLFPTVRIVKQYAFKEERPIFVVRSDLAFDERGHPYVKRTI